MACMIGVLCRPSLGTCTTCSPSKPAQHTMRQSDLIHAPYVVYGLHGLA